MAKNRPSQYLKFLARLYELAADFDQRELLAIQRAAGTENNKVVSTAASLLMELRGDKATRLATRAQKKAPVSSEDGLREVLTSKTMFPSNAALAELARPFMDLPEKSKDSRERLVTRILRGIARGTGREREAFRRALENHIAKQNGGSDFVSRWTKVIREL